MSLEQSLAVMSTARHRERLNGHYVSSVAGYSPPFAAKLRDVTGNSPFWDPTPYLAQGPRETRRR